MKGPVLQELDPFLSRPVPSVRDRNHFLTDGAEKYIWRPVHGTEELFDLRQDTQELDNLADREDCADRLREEAEIAEMSESTLEKVYEVLEMMQALARRHEVVGIDLVEVAPDYDPTGSTSILAAQLLLNTLGFIFHARGFS